MTILSEVRLFQSITHGSLGEQNYFGEKRMGQTGVRIELHPTFVAITFEGVEKCTPLANVRQFDRAIPDERLAGDTYALEVREPEVNPAILADRADKPKRGPGRPRKVTEPSNGST